MTTRTTADLLAHITRHYGPIHEGHEDGAVVLSVQQGGRRTVARHADRNTAALDLLRALEAAPDYGKIRGRRSR